MKNLFCPSYGGNRNFTLMSTLGGLMVTSDDDMRPFSLMENGPEFPAADEISCGRLHRAGQKGYSKKSFDIMAAFMDVLSNGDIAPLMKSSAIGGSALLVESSGKQHWVHVRWSYPKVLRQTFHEWALHSIASFSWAKTYYDQQRLKGKSHHSSVRALAFKWIRILFRCWQDRKPYDRVLYEKAINLRSQERDTRSAAVEIQWKECAGFVKVLPLLRD